MINFTKGFDFLYNKTRVLMQEKKYKYKNINLNYIMQKNDSDTLFIIFSACTRKGIKARYNYIRTLEKYNVNKLFILDNFGEDKRGAYYLGKNKEFIIQDSVESLIDTKIKEVNAKKIVFIGSSKGGYAAINFGYKYKDSTIIVGAPQYLLGNYLKVEDNRHILTYIMGNSELDSVEYLNNFLKEKVENIKFFGKVYIHCSDSEHTYANHIKYLINDLKRKNVLIDTEVLHYKNHGEVSNYFPKFLSKVLDEIMDVKI